MPVFRITTGYGQANMGWTETWWTPEDEGPLILPKLNALLEARAKILWNVHTFIGVRIAQVGARRKSIYLPAGVREWGAGGGNVIIPPTGLKTGTGQTTRPDQLRAAVQLRVTYGQGYQTIRYLAGIPDALSATEPATDDLQGDKQWVSDYVAYRQLLVGDGWQVQALDQTIPERTIRSITLQEAAPGLVGVGTLTGETTGAGPGDRVHIRGQTVNPCLANRKTLNGVWVVESVNTTLTTGQVVYFLKGTQGTDVTRFRFLGTIQRVGKSFSDITAINIHRVGIHKRGKPFASPVGRRKTRACLQS